MIWNALQPYVTRLGNTPFALWLGMSTWRIAGLLTVHLFGLTLLLGSVVLTGLNLLGLFQRQKAPAQLRREMQPVMLTGLTLMVLTGGLIFTGGAEAYFAGYWFRLKMMLLAAALIFHVTVYRIVARRERPAAIAKRLTGALMLLLWFGVACAGRAIAFF
jgi:cytochrome bd-type quinol oxidase subunit 2